jgi:hypothetical protein
MRPLLARLPRLLLVFTLVAIVAPEYSAAQTGLASLAPGMHVRVTAAPLGPAARPARVVSASADTLVVRPDDASGFDVTVPRTAITQLDVSVGRSTRKARLALAGAGAGALIGLVAGVASYTDPCVDNPAVCAGWFYETQQSAAAGGLVGGALLGAAAGAIAGQLWKTDRWAPYPLRLRTGALRIVPAPSRGRSVALVLTMPVT